MIKGEDEGGVRAANLCRLWEYYIKDPAWHQF